MPRLAIGLFYISANQVLQVYFLVYFGLLMRHHTFASNAFLVDSLRGWPAFEPRGRVDAITLFEWASEILLLGGWPLTKAESARNLSDSDMSSHYSYAPN